MKRLLLILALAILPIGLSAQRSELDGIFDEYAGRKEYQSVIYGKTMLGMMKENASDEVRALLDGIKMIRIISHKGEEDMLGNMVHAIVKKQYERISMVSGDGRVSQFYLYDPDSAKKDMSFVMTIEGEGESIVMEIIGRFDVKDITRLSSIGRKE